MPSLFRTAVPLLALALPACMGTQNRGLESVHQPVVSRAEYRFDVATGPQGLVRGEGERLAGWLDTIRLGYGDRVVLDDPGAMPATRDAVAAVVARHGLLLGDGPPVVGDTLAPGTARVIVARLRAGVPGCPDYSRDGSSEFDSNTSSNQGCAINSNLAAMVANPGDLVRGQPGSGTADPANNFRAIDAYRKAAPGGGGGGAVKSEGTGGK